MSDDELASADEPAEPTPRRRRRVKIALGLAVPAVLLLLLEAGFRLGGLGVPEIPPRTDPADAFEEVELVGPDGETHTYREGLVAGARARINEQRYREWIYPPEKPAGTLRVACLGDSYTFGQGLEEDEPWPRQLEELLAPSVPEGRRLEVLNFGLRGHETVDELNTFEGRVLGFEPDLLVLGFNVFNDAQPVTERKARVAGVVRHKTNTAVRFFKSIAHRSHLVTWAARFVRRRRNVQAMARHIEADYAKDAPGWLACRAALRTMAARCRERGIGMVVALFPSTQKSDPGINDIEGYPFREQHARIAAAFEDYPEVRVVDVIDGLGAFHLRRMWILGDGHPDAAYNRVVAEMVAPEARTLLGW